MDKATARKILALHRPGLMDTSDSQMSEALELARQDAELSAWLEQQEAVYNAIRGRLKEISVPPGLKRQILAEHVASTKILPLTNRFLMAAAAVAAMVMLTAIVWTNLNRNHEETFDSYRNRQARMVQRPTYAMEMFSSDLTQIRGYFQSKGAPTNYVMPKNLGTLPGVGAAVFKWNNHPVSLVCLNGATSPTEKNDLYLFMASSSVLPGAPTSGKKPEFKKINNLMTATWTVGDKVYLLAGSGDEQTLGKYLE